MDMERVHLKTDVKPYRIIKMANEYVYKILNVFFSPA